MAEKEQGELAVSVSGGWVRIVEADNGAAFAPIHLKIDYELVVGGDTVEGIVFRRPGDAGDDNVRNSRKRSGLTNKLTLSANTAYVPLAHDIRCRQELGTMY